MVRLTRRTFLLGMAGLTGLATLPFKSAGAAVQRFTPFSFAFVTDVHLTTSQHDNYMMLQESQLFLQQVVKELNKQRTNFVVFGGDQVEEPGRQESNWHLFLDCLNVLEAPWYFVLGEQDSSGHPPADKVRTYGADWKDQGVSTATSWWSITPKYLSGVHLVGLDTSIANSPTGDMSARQLAWLKQDLGDALDLFSLVFCHHPLLPPQPYDGGPPWDQYVMTDGAAAREILAEAGNVHLVTSGHLHTNKVQQEGSIWHVSCPSLAVYPCSYKIFHVHPEGITMETYAIEYPSLIKKAFKLLVESPLAYKYDNKNPESFATLARGEEQDLTALLPMAANRQPEPLSAKKLRKQREEDGEKRRRQEKEDQMAAGIDAKPPDENSGGKRKRRRKRKGKAADAPQPAPEAGTNSTSPPADAAPSLEPSKESAPPEPVPAPVDPGS